MHKARRHTSSRCIAFAVAGYVTAVSASPCIAQKPERDDRNKLTVAVGAGLAPSYDGSDDYRPIAGALVRGKVDGFSFSARGTRFHLDLLREPEQQQWNLSVGPALSVRLNRTGRIKDAQVKALGQLDTAWEVGGWVGIGKSGVLTSRYDTLSARLTYLKDVGGAHKSYIITPTIDYALPLSEATLLGVSFSVDYVGKGYGRYYYDVTQAGSTFSGLRAYAVAGQKAGFAKLSVGTVLAQSLSGDLSKGWAIFALAGYGRVLGRYAESPIVRDAGNRNQGLGGLGIAYSF